jgi:hypothetical protein
MSVVGPVERGMEEEGESGLPFVEEEGVPVPVIVMVALRV